jgi:hypothetical protein
MRKNSKFKDYFIYNLFLKSYNEYYFLTYLQFN